MVKATWRILALSALMGAVALPVSAQVVIGGSGQPAVEVNWAVLDSLGRQPTLADMLRDDMPVKPATSSAKLPGQKQAGVQYKPFKSAPPARKTATAPAPRHAPKVVPVAAKTEAAPVPAPKAEVKPVHAKAEAVKPEPVKPEPVKTALPPKPQLAEVPPPVKAVEPAKPAEAKPVGPQVALPEIKAPTPIAPAPAQVAKAEPPPLKVEPAKVEPAKPAPAAVVAPAPAPVPPPAAAKAEPVPQPQVASLPSGGGVTSKGDTLSLAFSGEDAKLPAGAQSELQSLARRMEKDDGLALQLLAYAAGDEAGASKARRLSLSRALEVRKFLMEQGVRSTRIEVRALGNKLDGPGPADRVDAVLVNR